MTKKCYIAGGCFWGLEDLVRYLPGVKNTQVGYMGGQNFNPTYKDHPGHAEAVEIEYDPEVITFEYILKFFFRVHNPTTFGRQGNDVGASYRSVIFYRDDSELLVAQNVIKFVDKSGKWPNSVVTTLEGFNGFWDAEDEHQDYLLRNPGGYSCHRVYFEDWGNKFDFPS